MTTDQELINNYIDDQQQTDKESIDQSGPNETPLLEWFMAAIGLVLLLFSISFLTYREWNDNQSPPDITINVTNIHQTGNGYLLLIRASNKSSSTAAQLKITGKLLDNGTEVENNEITFDYLPAHSHREGGIIFQQNPSQYQLQLQTKSYAKP